MLPTTAKYVTRRFDGIVKNRNFATASKKSTDIPPPPPDRTTDAARIIIITFGIAVSAWIMSQPVNNYDEIVDPVKKAT
jgi:hypothetical protein